MVTSTRRTAIAFLSAALFAACGPGSNSEDGTESTDPVGTVINAAKNGPTSSNPTKTDPGTPSNPTTTNPTTTNPATPPPVAGACPADLATAQGDLRARLQNRPIAAAGSEGFVAPSAAQQTAFTQAFSAFVSQPSNATAQALTALGFTASCFADPTNGNYLLVEDGAQNRGGGTYAVSLQPAHDVWLEVPHAPSDEGTLEEGIQTLFTTKARALLITGSHRCADAAATTCSGSTVVCSGQLRISDVAHFGDNFFTAAHRALRTQFPSTVAVSIHGMDTPGGESAVTSDGTGVKRGASISLRFRNALNALLPGGLGAYSCNDSGDDGKHRDLCGTTNVQGRWDNASANACTANSSTPSDHFLHVEQGPELRGVASSQNLPATTLGQALNAVVPAI